MSLYIKITEIKKITLCADKDAEKIYHSILMVGL